MNKRAKPAGKPEQLRGADDSATKGFIWKSVVERLPKICLSIGFSDLAQDLRNETLTLKEDLDARDCGPDWTVFVRDEISRSKGNKNCMRVSWFLLENYVYRLMLGECGYFAPGHDNYMKDPFLSVKLESLKSALPTFVESLASPPSLSRLVLCCLWGNRSDLSLSSGSVEHVATGVQENQENTLACNDIQAFQAFVENDVKPGNTVIIILDNVGAELLADLRLAHYLVSSVGARVVLHSKFYPVFVSDAVPADIKTHVQELLATSKSQAFGQELEAMMNDERIMVEHHQFYCSPLEFDQLVDPLKQKYDAAALILVKGDANYRRILGDRYYACDEDFTNLVATGITKTPLLAIRTCKSPVIVGVPRSQVEELAKRDPDWCVNGTVGVLQFSRA